MIRSAGRGKSATTCSRIGTTRSLGAIPMLRSQDAPWVEIPASAPESSAAT